MRKKHTCDIKGEPQFFHFVHTEEKKYNGYNYTCSVCEDLGPILDKKAKEKHEKILEARYLKLADKKDKRILEAISSERYEEIKIIFKTLDRISETAQDLKAAIYERAYYQTLSKIRDFDSLQDYVREVHNLTSDIFDKLQCELKWLE